MGTIAGEDIETSREQASSSSCRVYEYGLLIEDVPSQGTSENCNKNCKNVRFLAFLVWNDMR